jgi:hypothetical protein
VCRRSWSLFIFTFILIRYVNVLRYQNRTMKYTVEVYIYMYISAPNRLPSQDFSVSGSYTSPTLAHVVSTAEVEVNLRPTVCPGVRRLSGTRDQFFFLLEISFGQLRLCYFVAPSLTRGRVIYLYNFFWALPKQSVLGRSSAELTATFYCLIWVSLNLEGQIPVLISPRNRSLH